MKHPEQFQQPAPEGHREAADEAGSPATAPQQQVLLDREVADDAPATVVGRDEGESQAACLGRRSWRDGIAGQPKRAHPGSSGKEAFDKSAAARADDAVHADDLARSDRERDVADTGRVEVAHVEDRLYVLDRRLDRLTLDELERQLAAD